MTSEQVRSEHHKKSNNGAAGPASAADILERMENETFEPKREGGGIGKTIRDVVIVTGLLAGGTYLYYSNVTTKQAVNALVVEATQDLEKDDIPALNRAEEKFKEALNLKSSSADALAGMAEVAFYKSQHGFNTKAEAEDYLRKAQAEAPDKPGVLAVKAYLQIVSGQASQAASELKAMLEAGNYHPKLAHAYGWAALEEGRYDEAARAVRQAIDTRFSAVRFSNTMAEISHRRGDEAGAIRNLSKSLSTSMNPDHEIALGWSAALRAKNFGNLGTPAQQIKRLSDKGETLGPFAKGYLHWAKAELSLALGNPEGSFPELDEAEKHLPGFPPLTEARGRALYTQGKKKDALAELEKAAAMKPQYLGVKWLIAEYKSRAKNDQALELLTELEAEVPEKERGPEFELFRAEHFMRKGDLKKAKEHFTKAAELGDDAKILLGLARITFEEEKKKGKKADLDAVSTAFEEVYNKKATMPELHESLAAIELWNFNTDGADKAFGEAEANHKKLRRPVSELLEFYDRAIDAFKDANEKEVRAKAEKLAADWTKKKEEYLRSVASLQN